MKSNTQEILSVKKMSDVEDDGSAGAAAPPARIKEVGTTSVACPMLTQTNYTVWALRMKVVQAIPEALVMQIGDVSSAKALWDAIKARHVGADRVKEARLQTLNTDFDRLRMNETESIDSFAGELSGLASKSTSLGETIDESKLVKKLVKVFPKRFIHLVASLEQVLDLKSVGFEDVVGRLKAYEERIRGNKSEDEQQRVMFTRTGGGCGESSSSGGGMNGVGGGVGSSGKKETKWGRKGGSGGFNRNGSSGSGGGSGSAGPSGSGPRGNRPSSAQNYYKPKNKPKFYSDSNRNPKKDLLKIICYRCDKSGHYASKCPDRTQKFQESNFTEQDDADETIFFS